MKQKMSNISLQAIVYARTVKGRVFDTGPLK